MLDRLTQLFNRSRAVVPQARGAWRWWGRSAGNGYDGASGSRRASGWGRTANRHAASQAARVPLSHRARALVANNGYAAAGVEAWVAALNGTGIVPAVAGDIATRWTAWTDTADADGVGDFYALAGLMVRGMIVDGESFVLLINTPAGLTLRVLHPEQVDASRTALLSNGGRIVNGIEFDAFGTRVAYWIVKDRPEIGLMPLTAVRVPAEDVVHLFRADFAGQVRGVSWFAPALVRLAELDEWHGAQVMRQKIGALLTGFVTTTDGAVPFEAEAQDGAVQIGSLEPGAMVVLPPGKDVRFSDPPAIAAEANEFAKITLHEIAAALGLPYEVLTGDLAAVNYSSIRAGLVEWRRRIEMIQHNVIVFQMLRPIWRRWVTLEGLAGRIEGRLEEMFAVRWITPKQQWVDPSKDVKAEIDAIGAGLMSRREAVASRGMDIAALDAEIAADNARAKALGLAFATGVPTPAPASETEEAAA